MSAAESQTGHALPDEEILTLREIATFLRVPEEAVTELAGKEVLPGQKIGGEWRFLKGAVIDWLRFGATFRRDLRMVPPPWMLDHPFWEELLQILEKRILSKVPAAEETKRGSRDAVLRHFGVFKDDADLEEQLARLRARQEASGE